MGLSVFRDGLSVFRDGLSTIFWMCHKHKYINHLHAVYDSEVGRFLWSRSIRDRVFNSVRTTAFTHNHIPLSMEKMQNK